MYWNHNTAFHPRLLRTAQRLKGPILDVGCGDGLLVSKLARLGNRVVGLDPDYKAVTAARQRCAGFTNVEIQQTGFLEAVLNDDTFALITSVAVLHHMDSRLAMHRAARLLRPGGVLYFVGVPRLDTRADFLWAISQMTRARIIGRLRHEYYPHDIPRAPSDLSLGDIRALASQVLPDTLVKRAPYYRYTLRWTRPK
jgi:2-polyprenyl-3-methyl-5-hydroxy-6-metoxy-1,4-benzoquinol methylase